MQEKSLTMLGTRMRCAIRWCSFVVDKCGVYHSMTAAEVSTVGAEGRQLVEYQAPPSLDDFSNEAFLLPRDAWSMLVCCLPIGEVDPSCECVACDRAHPSKHIRVDPSCPQTHLVCVCLLRGPQSATSWCNGLKQTQSAEQGRPIWTSGFGTGHHIYRFQRISMTIYDK